MRVALCINGQPRTWAKSWPNWCEYILPGVEKDVFFHMWDYNSLPTLVNTIIGAKNNVDRPISDQERDQIVDTIKPKKWQFDSRNVNPTGNYDPRIINERVKEPIGWWCRSQFYSMWYAAQLKRQYELEHGFEYDLVIRLRTDLMFLKHLRVPETIAPNTLYSVSNGWMTNTESFMIGDTLYMSDSFTYDQISEFTHSLQYTDTYDLVPRHIKCPPPEVALYPYVRSLGIKNVSYPQHFKILRTQEYVDIKKGLSGYEII